MTTPGQGARMMHGMNETNENEGKWAYEEDILREACRVISEKGPSEIDLSSFLQAAFPDGHPLFTKEIAELAELHSQKNADYASQASPLGNFDRVSALLDMYPILDTGNENYRVAALYYLKQFDAVFHALSGTRKMKESVQSRLKDMAVYAILMAIMIEEHEDENERG